MSALHVALLSGWLGGWLGVFGWTWVQAARNAALDRRGPKAIDYDWVLITGLLGCAWPVAIIVLPIGFVATRADAAMRRAFAPKPTPAALPETSTYRTLKGRP